MKNENCKMEKMDKPEENGLLAKISAGEMSRVLAKAISEGLVGEEDTAVLFHDLARLRARLAVLIEAFPPSALHAAAIKANPLRRILEYVRSLGAGAEAASLAELLLAERAGFPAEKIVFDSPAKTREEIAYALSRRVHLNVDNLVELDRAAAWLAAHPSRSTVGLRVNPQVGAGKILSTSVAGEYSKFGVPLKSRRPEIMQRFLQYDWLKGIHLHVGSQGCPLDLLVEGVAAVFEFAHEVNLAAKGRIEIFDIGGGLPVSYRSGEEAVSVSRYRRAIETRCPGLMSGEFKIVTEFGRYLQANAGWAASRVEYVKEDPGLHTAMVHVGADLFLRKCLNPEEWHHDISATDSGGELKTTPEERYVVAGPLCFSGDIIARGIALPRVKEGDYLLIHDAGAYTLGMWSKYNSRPAPKVIGYYGDSEEFQILKPRENLESVLGFWE